MRFVVSLVLCFGFMVHAQEKKEGDFILVPDKDGGVYKVPANDPGLLEAVRAKVAANASASVARTPPTPPAPQGALDEVNAARARRGLRPFIYDEALTAGAVSAANYRAQRRIEGHTHNDFSFLPPGTRSSAAGCAAWPVGAGWGSCCTYDNYSHAGAGFAIGVDGRRYMHLFVR